MDNPGIKIRGEHYDWPQFDTITIAEEHALFIYGDCLVRDFIPAHPEITDEEKAAWEKRQLLRLRNPAFRRALAYIAIRRAHTDMKEDEAWKLAGEANALEVDIAMLWGDGPDPQKSSQKPLENKTPTSEPSSSTDSGSSTKNGSDAAAVIPAPTGTSESGTSSPGVPPIALAS